jgi:hypothetical protein
MPVETNSIGREGTRSLGLRPRVAARAAKRRAGKTRGLLSHGNEDWAAIVEREFDGENPGAGLLQDVDAAFGSGDHAEFSEKKPSADDGMASEGQLLSGGEDAEAGQSTVVGRTLDENRFGQIHFPGNGLHLFGGQAVAVSDDRERIAGEGLGGENIESVETAFHRLAPQAVRAGDFKCASILCEFDRW